ATVSDCAAVNENGSTRRVGFRLAPYMQYLLKIVSFTVYMNEREETIQRITVVPAAATGTSSIDVVFHELSYAYAATALDAPVLRRFVDERGELLPRYRGYTLVDLRGGTR